MTPRATQPRLWRHLAVASAAASLAVATPMSADTAAYGKMGARLWLAEGGEAGESGIVAQTAPDVAYLAELAIVEGHLVGAAELYRKGASAEAIDLASHPEAEKMMDELRLGLAAHGAADVTPAMLAFSAAMQQGETPDAVDLVLTAASAAFAKAAAPERAELRARFDALLVLVRAAGGEYAGSIEAGVVTEPMAFHEAHGFIQVALAQARLLSAEADPKAAAAATKVLEALAASDEAFGDIMTGDLIAQDPAILLAVAARIELAISSVR